MDKSNLTAEGVALILEASAKAGVSELSFGDLQISFVPKFGQSNQFGGYAPAQIQMPAGMTEAEFVAQMQQYPFTPASATPLTDAQHAKNFKEQVEVDEVKLRADRLEELRLSDPYAYEQMILGGQLDGERPKSADDGDEAEAD